MPAIDYDARQQALAVELGVIERERGLGPALDALRHHQVESGFIRDDLSEVIRNEFHDPAGSGAYFSTQFNPARARRFGGAGTTTPPEGTHAINGNCFLCAENIRWQQEGRELGYPLGGASIRYTAWMNPFPLAVGHAIFASDAHCPQHWLEGGIDLDHLIGDLLGFSHRLPGWIVFYNGVGAGASIEGHLHYHAMPRTPGLGPMPIERAADRHRSGPIARGLYPMDFAHWRGDFEGILDQARPWLSHWQAHAGHAPDATANLMATCDAESGRMDLYFVPRHRLRSRGEGLGGVIGAFETMGEIICSTPDERNRIESGDVDYGTIHDLLAHVAVALDD